MRTLKVSHFCLKFGEILSFLVQVPIQVPVLLLVLVLALVLVLVLVLVLENKNNKILMFFARVLF